MKTSTKLAIALWAFLALSGVWMAVTMLATVAAAAWSLFCWLVVTAIAVGAVWILHNKFETWLDDRAARKTSKRWVPWSD